MFPSIRWTLSLLGAMPKTAGYYAVRHGRVPGIYTTWAECENQVKGFKKPAFKKFPTLEAAEQFMCASDQAPSSPPHNDSNTLTHGGNTLSNRCTESSGIDSACHPSLMNSRSNGNLPSSHVTANPVGLGHVTVKTEGLGHDGSNSKPVEPRGLTLESLNNTVVQLQATVDRMLCVMEGLSSDITRVQGSVEAMEKALFAAPGSKRSFSTSASASGAESKKAKLDKLSAGKFTGVPFEDSEGVHVYTDGGCFGNGQAGARAGFGVFWNEEDPSNVSEPLSGRASNNRAEIHAAVRAVQIAKQKGISKLILHTDSQFLINSITKWIKAWKRNGWKLSTGHPVINKDDFTALDNELTGGISVKWVYVRGHSGDPCNDAADRLAKLGAEQANS